MSTAFSKGADIKVPVGITLIHNLFTAVLSHLVEAEKNKKQNYHSEFHYL